MFYVVEYISSEVYLCLVQQPVPILLFCEGLYLVLTELFLTEYILPSLVSFPAVPPPHASPDRSPWVW